jgi:hypothetical protein
MYGPITLSSGLIYAVHHFFNFYLFLTFFYAFTKDLQPCGGEMKMSFMLQKKFQAINKSKRLVLNLFKSFNPYPKIVFTSVLIVFYLS